jgi:hypothetical protein
MHDSDRLRQLVDLVSKMRAVQRQYFKTRSVATLDEARKIERAVDAWLAEHAPSDQRRLFDREEV